MKRQILLILAIVSILQTIATAETLYVSTRSRDYHDIQDAIDNSQNGDVIIVEPGVYSGNNNVDLDFGGRAITLRSLYPNDPCTVASTIIDCQGTMQNPHRAFNFISGEGNDSKVLGFTIINGYQTGTKGQDESILVNKSVFGLPEDQIDDKYFWFWRAKNGGDANALSGVEGYGGAILCFGSSPTIQYCVIKDCTVVGPVGGNGADGLNGKWTLTIFDIPPKVYEFDDGQWGGHGGIGIGNGYGGAIACRVNANPVISDCTFENNIARGGIGGDGGDGGNGAGEAPDYSQGWESFGGDGGDGIGDGMGGAIYCDNSDPVVTRCTFIDNTATLAMGGTGGLKGIGTDIDLQ